MFYPRSAEDSLRIAVAFVLGAAIMVILTRAFASSSSRRASKGMAKVDVPRELKMTLVVNTSLGMSKGKIGAQTAHAAVGAYRSCAISDQHEPLLARWERQGAAKICLKASSAEELDELMASARKRNVQAFIVRDAGRTQIEAGSKTVLALGPAGVDVINELCGHLKLL